jgi:hypothetical protein
MAKKENGGLYSRIIIQRLVLLIEMGCIDSLSNVMPSIVQRGKGLIMSRNQIVWIFTTDEDSQ